MRIHPEMDETLYLIDQKDYTMKYCDFDQNMFEFEITLKQERSSLYTKILENGQTYTLCDLYYLNTILKM